MLASLILLLTCSVTGFAQWQVGIQVGYVKAWEEYRVELPEDARIHVEGFRLGATVYRPIGQSLSVGVEPSYVQRGAACEPGFIVFNRDTKLFLDYLELPLLAQYSQQLFSPRLEAIVGAGYSLGYLLSANRQVFDLGSGSILSDDDLDIPNSSMRRIDHGFRAAVGLNYHFSTFSITARYARFYAMTDVDRELTSRNREMSLNLGISTTLSR